MARIIIKVSVISNCLLITVLRIPGNYSRHLTSYSQTKFRWKYLEKCRHKAGNWGIGVFRVLFGYLWVSGGKSSNEIYPDVIKKKKK